MNTENANSKKKNKKSFSKDILPWILSFVAAFALWVYVSSVENPSNESKFTEIPITFTDNANGLSIISNTNPTVNVTVHGKKSVVSNMTSASFSAVADITEIDTTGTHTVRVTVTTPEDVTITEKSIDELEVFIDQKGSKDIPVEVKLQNCIPAEGYKIYDDRIEKSVDSVTVSGPVSELDKIASARVVIPLDESQSVKHSVTANNMEMVFIDTEGNLLSSPYISCNVADVTVTIPVYQTKTIKTAVDFKDTGFDRSSADITIIPESIKIEGIVEDISDISVYTVTVDEAVSIPETLTKEISETDFTVQSAEKTVTVRINEKAAG